MKPEISKLEVYKELFRRRIFDFITVFEGKKHEKQEEALMILTGNKCEEFVYGGAIGGAKGLSVDEVVLTPFGFREIGKLKVGSNICATDGTVQQVIKKYDNGVIPFYRLTFADGTTIDCDYSHLWLAWKVKSGRKISNKRTFGEDSLRKYVTQNMYDDFIKNKTIYSIPLTEPVVFNVAGSLYGNGNFVKRDLDPYTLGVLIGDGCLRKNEVSFSSPDNEISKRISEKYKLSCHGGKNECATYSFVGETGLEVKDYLYTINLMGKYSYEKFIPKIYLHGSINERWDLLNGLMDTDGYASEDGDSYYSTSSKQLAEDVTYLARSLGCFVSQTIDENPFYKDENGDKVFCRASYKLRIKSKSPQKIFFLKRKRDRVKNKVHQSYGNRIVNIEKIKDKKSICITVSNPNSLFITKNFIVTHNSWTGCVWLLFMCLLYPKTKYFIARNELKRITESTLLTFFKVCSHYGVDQSLYNFNAVKNIITFSNGSRIDLLELKFQPRDPLFERLGSTEYTCGWIEEAGEVDQGAKDVLLGRIGRQYNVDYGILEILFMTCNPKRNWLYYEYYLPFKKGILSTKKRFVQALIKDNPFIGDVYEERLRRGKTSGNKAAIQRARLLDGDWDYEDDDTRLFAHDDIEALFVNTGQKKDLGFNFLVIDPAGRGKNRTVAGVFRGSEYLEKVYCWDNIEAPKLVANLIRIKERYGIADKRMIYDDDGVGNYLGGYFPKAFRFKGGAKPFLPENKDEYPNVRTEFYYMLSDDVEEGKLFIEDQRYKEEIVAELSAIKADKVDDDSKSYIKKKEDIKKDLQGQSPDFADVLMMSRVAKFARRRSKARRAASG